MGVMTVIKKIGEKILSVVEYPFKKAEQLEAILSAVEKGAPGTKNALVGTVQLVEALGEDAIAALAEHGLNLPDDLKVSADMKALFAYVKDTLWPQLDADYIALQSAVTSNAQPVAAAPIAAAATQSTQAVVD